MPVFGIHRISHVGLRVSDLEKARSFYCDILGFVEVEKSGDELYLKGVEEGQHHSLVLRKGSEPGLSYIAFRVNSPEDLERARDYYRSMGLPVSRFSEKGVSDAIAVEDPYGFPLVFYYDMEYTGDLGLKYSQYRGAPPVRLSHVNISLPVRDLDEALKYYIKDLGFILTEYFLGEDGSKHAAWVTSYYKHDSHDVALGKTLGKDPGPGFHHVAYIVPEMRDMVRVADILASLGMWDSIERGPGRHGATRAFYFYIRDPDGIRIELFTGDYVILDPDKWKPIEWRFDQARYRSDFWGRPIPGRWKEIKPVESIVRGGMKPLEGYTSMMPTIRW
ncbi:MAG TPA: 3,4-dihydroxyphenylacetate 2,3-dioxygenase [Sulfolobales archaeon]|nr:3,4-dihydroxyphenylacetate 2,3-dioxygenase [Sulfolobales archaeon]